MSFFELRLTMWMCMFICADKQWQLSYDLTKISVISSKAQKLFPWYCCFALIISPHPVILITSHRGQYCIQGYVLYITSPKLSGIPMPFGSALCTGFWSHCIMIITPLCSLCRLVQIKHNIDNGTSIGIKGFSQRYWWNFHISFVNLNTLCHLQVLEMYFTFNTPLHSCTFTYPDTH